MLLIDALDGMFKRSIESCLGDSLPDGGWYISSLQSTDGVEVNEAIFLTICSHQFRIFLTLHFDIEKCTSFYRKALKISAEDVSDQSVYDFLYEVGNSICGVLKRDLGTSIPALGMSTPNLLSQGCFDFISVFDVVKSGNYSVEVDSDFVLYAGYFYCRSDDVEIEVVEQSVDDVESGELEFF